MACDATEGHHPGRAHERHRHWIESRGARVQAELAAQGLAVIMVSSEIPEIMGMSDRVIVMREGRIAAELSGDDLTPEVLVRHAAGILKDAR